MSKSNPSLPRIHEDAVLFRRAVDFTAAETGFASRLIEKDYFCTLLLGYLTSASDALVFKGGTCLAKVHAGFYRLSEDLDFVIPMAADAPRGERRAQAADLKSAVAAIPRWLPVFSVVQPLTGSNRSTQYVATIEYESHYSRQQDHVKIEVGLREPLLTPVLNGKAQTLLVDPVSGGEALVTPQMIRCISRIEAFAEKFRAALSRREVAIRDFYDIDYAIRKLELRPSETDFITLVRQKLSIPGNDPVDVSEQRLDALKRQVDSQLKPVLREKDFQAFDLDRAFDVVAEIAAKLL